MKKIVFILLLSVTTIFTSFAQKVSLQAPSVCEVGKRVNISYIVDTQDVEDIRVGEFTGFELLYGPSTSKQSSFQMINGKTTHSSTITFTYVLLAEKEGEFTLPPATVVINGKNVKSESATIKVLPSDNSANSSASGSATLRHQHGGGVNDKDFFITATASKTNIYEQEAVVLTYKLYTLVNIRQIAGDMPELDGFHCQELNSKAQLSLKYEHYNGRNYGTAVWRQYVLFPQKSGKLTIPSVSFDAEIEITNTSADPFDIFFGGGSLTQLVRRTIKTPKIEINVSPLPQPIPINFSGAVGKFSMSGTLSPVELNANDATSLRLAISGHGNMKLMKAPVLDVPKDFEIYTPKETDKTTNTTQGAKGNIVFDYVIVPRHSGQYSIKPVEFVYFNPESEKYVTLRTDSFHLSVAKSHQTISTVHHEKEDLRVLTSDIHYINTGSANIKEEVDDFFGKTSYIITYLGLILIFLIVLVIFYRHAKANADIVRKRGKRAGKEATKRLKLAFKLLQAKHDAPFYEETSRALIGYVGDKLNIPLTHLNKENVRESLLERSVNEEYVKQYIDAIEACEFARFAPGDPIATMDKIYEQSTQAINLLEKNL